MHPTIKSRAMLFCMLSLVPTAIVAQGYDPDHRHVPAALQEDFAILRGALEEGHPGLYRYSSKPEMDRHFERMAARITEPMTELDFLRVVGATLSRVNDGHTRVSGTEPFGEYVQDAPIRLPFKLAFIAGHAYLHRNYSDLGDELLGAEVVSINGRPMGTVAEDLFTLISSDGRVRTSKYRRLEGTTSFGGFFSTMYGWTTEFELELSLRDGSTRAVTVPGLTAEALTSRLRERYADVAVNQPPIEIAYRDRIPVLTVRTFGRAAYRNAGIDFGEFLRDAFQGMANSGAQDLVIDVRNNGGGSDAFGKMLVAHLLESPFDYYAALELKHYRFDFMRYTTSPDREFPEDRRRANDRGMYDVLGHPNLGQQQPLDPRFRGRVWVLQNGGSFSATGEFTSVLHQNRPNTVFVGEESGAGYYGNVSGESVRLVLPNSGLRVSMPLIKYSSAVSGYTPVDRGLIPDMAMEPSIEDVLAGRDCVLERVLEMIEESGRPR